MPRSKGGGPPSQRQLRVGEEIRHVLVAIFQRGDLHDPVLEGANVTVTEVRISPDLKAATVFVTPLGGKDVVDIVAACKRAAPHLRGQLARQLTLRAVPSLHFQADKSFEQATHIEALLHDPRVLRDLEPKDEA